MEAYLSDQIRARLTRYAENDNFSQYRTDLAAAVREVLSNRWKSRLRNSIPKNLVFPDGSEYFFSFHYNSRILRRWLRVTGDEEQAYGRVRYSPTEVQKWKDVYDWDSKTGHLLVDDSVKEAFAVAFGDSVCIHKGALDWCLGDLHWEKWFTFTRQHFSWFVSRGNLLENRCKPPSGMEWPKWPMGQKLRTGKIWRAVRKGLPRFRNRGKKMWREEDVATRNFILTFFYSIGVQSSASGTHDHIVLGVPILDDPHFDKHSELHGLSPHKTRAKTRRLSALKTRAKLASVAFVCFHPPAWRKGDITTIQQYLDTVGTELARELAYFELQLLPADVRFATSDENKIREACEVDSELHTQRQMANQKLYAIDKYRDRWKFLLGDLYTHDLPKVCDFWRKLIASQQLLGASERYWTLIEDIKSAALSFVEENNKSHHRGSQAIFLYSEPGCGKENLAALVHLITVLAIFRDLQTRKTRQLHHSVNRADRKAIIEHAANALVYETHQSLKPLVKLQQRINRWEVRLGRAVQKVDPFFNYHPTSAAHFGDRQEFLKAFLGDYTNNGQGPYRLGPFLAAHFLRGTVFLDEFNTFADPRWANNFLRLFDKPHECEIPGRNPAALRNASVLMICASNWSREELIRRGFNSAVIYRLTKRYFVIPPLRERPVDIAIFVNARVRQYNEVLLKKGKTAIDRIASDAMRLICDLPWPDNYRGVIALLDDVLEQRARREINDPVLSFRQVLEGLRRRELLLSQPGRDEPRRLKLEVG